MFQGTHNSLSILYKYYKTVDILNLHTFQKLCIILIKAKIMYMVCIRV